MTVDTNSPFEQLDEADAHNLARVYAFLLKRAREHRIEMAADETPQPSPEPQLPSEENISSPITGNTEA